MKTRYIIICFFATILFFLSAKSSKAIYIYYDEIEVFLSQSVLFEIAADETNSYHEEIGKIIMDDNANLKKVEISRSKDHIQLKLSALKGKNILSPTIGFYKNDLYRISNIDSRAEIVEKMKRSDPNIKSINSEFNNDVLKLTFSYKLPKPIKVDAVEAIQPPAPETKPEPMGEPVAVTEPPEEPPVVAATPVLPTPTTPETTPTPEPAPATIIEPPKVEPEPDILEPEPVEKIEPKTVEPKPEPIKAKPPKEPKVEPKVVEAKPDPKPVIPESKPKPEPVKEITLGVKSKDVIDYRIELEPVLELKDNVPEVVAEKPEPKPEPVKVEPPRETKPETKVAESAKKAATSGKDGLKLIVNKLQKRQRLKVDGDSNESAWKEIEFLTVMMERPGKESIELKIKAFYSPDRIYFMTTWRDNSLNDTYETLIWNERKKEYYVDKDMEDSLAFLFYMNGINDPCMKSGVETTADYWHWRAGRLKDSKNAYDGTMVISSSPLTHANAYPSHDGKMVWIRKEQDDGKAPCKIQLPVKYIGERAPSYLSCIPTKSSADVTGVAQYYKKKWTVEFSRALDTSYDDDIVFNPSKKYNFALAVYDGAEKDAHFTSKMITLEFE